MRIGSQKHPSFDQEHIQALPSRKTIFLSVFLIIILGFSVYANTLNNKFVWDDDVLVVDNPYIKEWAKVKNIFTEDVGAGSGREYYFYRPLPMMTYLIDYSLWELNPKGYHLTNIAWHIMAALALYWLIILLFRDNFLSLVTSAFFVVHPLHTEVVTYISGRSDALSLFFVLMSFIFYIKRLRQPGAKFTIGMILCYTAAVFSRENSLILPVLLLLYHYTFKEKVKLKGFLSILGVAGIYITLRLTLLKGILSEIPDMGPALQRLPGIFVAMTNYIRLLFLPFDLHMEYGQRLFSPLDPKVFMGMAIILSVTYVLRRYRCHKTIIFSVLWFFVSILPVSNIYPLNAYMAEHWLYLPSIGFFLILAEGSRFFYQRKRTRSAVLVCMISLFTLYSYQTVQQNTFWKEPVSFYKRTLRYAPNSYKTNHNLGLIYFDMGKHEEAIALYQKAIETKPNSKIVHNHLGIAYSAIDDKEAAIASFKTAMGLDLKFAPTYYNLGNAYSSIGEKEKAISMFKMAIKFRPEYTEAYNNLGAAYADTGKNEAAIFAYEKALALNPDDADAYNNLGVTRDDIGQTQTAIGLFKKTIEINRNHTAAHANLSRVYFKMKQYQSAVEYFDKAQKLGFTNPALFEALKQYR